MNARLRIDFVIDGHWLPVIAPGSEAEEIDTHEMRQRVGDSLAQLVSDEIASVSDYFEVTATVRVSESQVAS